MHRARCTAAYTAWRAQLSRSRCSRGCSPRSPRPQAARGPCTPMRGPLPSATAPPPACLLPRSLRGIRWAVRGRSKAITCITHPCITRPCIPRPCIMRPCIMRPCIPRPCTSSASARARPPLDAHDGPITPMHHMPMCVCVRMCVRACTPPPPLLLRYRDRSAPQHPRASPALPQPPPPPGPKRGALLRRRWWGQQARTHPRKHP